MSEPKLIGGLLDYAAEFPYPFSDEEDRRFRKERVRAEVERAEQDLADLRSMCSKALAGVYGASAKAVAMAWCDDICARAETVAGLARREDLEALRVALRKVPDRQSG